MHSAADATRIAPGWVVREVRLDGPPSALAHAVGALRVAVWRAEGALDESLFPTGVWWDADDARPSTRHWVAESADGTLLGAARVTLHADAAVPSRDLALWAGAGRALPLPVADLSRLVVDASARRASVGGALNRARLDALRADGVAATAIATSSSAQSRLLLAAGFVDTGLTVSFDDRPGVVFRALELRLREV